MSTSTPHNQPRRAVIRCLPQDAAAITRLAYARVRRERPGSAEHRYLDDLIRKPWGCEFRVYDDALIDVWMLKLRAGTRTSMHCHARKDTFLLCVSGQGAVVTGSARHIPVHPGSVLQIEQGASHCSHALTGMTLIEIETPRDKFDLVRLEDDHGRRRTGYEGAAHTGWLDPPLEPVTGGPPKARVRPRCVSGSHRFALELGVAVQQNPEPFAFAISLDPLGVLRRDIAISALGDLGDIVAEHTYLTIRNNHQEDSP
jgi:mannose-6-phosphate isomerase-like protein (cupin superfamily)